MYLVFWLVFGVMNLQTISNALEPESKFYFVDWWHGTLSIDFIPETNFLITMSDPADQIKNDVIRIYVSHTYIMTSRWTEDRNLVLVIPREILTVVLRWGDELLGGCTLVQRVGPSPLGPQTLWGTWVWLGYWELWMMGYCGWAARLGGWDCLSWAPKPSIGLGLGLPLIDIWWWQW